MGAVGECRSVPYQACQDRGFNRCVEQINFRNCSADCSMPRRIRALSSRPKWNTHSGALIGMGIPEYEAKRYEGKVKDGNILISVHTEDSTMRDRAKKILEAAGAEDISYTGEASVPRDQKTAVPINSRTGR